MIEIEVEPGTEAWHKERLGAVSASKFDDVLKLPRAKKDQEAGVLSETAKSYLYACVAEILRGAHYEINARSLEWGTVEEEKARVDYAFDRPGVEVRQPGFCILEPAEGLARIGCTPDLFVGDDGLVEIKSPINPAIHIKTLDTNEVPKEYVPQVQGQLWITGRDWCDFVSFRNDLPPALVSHTIRVERDEAFIRDLSVAVKRFAALVHQKAEELKTH